MGIQFDTPLTRLNERNNYRQSLITYQQARRRWMAYVDTIHQTLRQEIRQINLNQINFEQNRAAVGIAIEKVDIARLRLMQPPAPGETTTFSNTFARDLLQALNDLLQAQNDFMSIWVNYEVQRISLDFDLGIMQLDDRGMWVDPGPVDGAKLMEQYVTECEPEELPFARQSAEDAERQEQMLREGKTERERVEEELPPPDPHTTDAVQFDPDDEAALPDAGTYSLRSSWQRQSRRPVGGSGRWRGSGWLPAKSRSSKARQILSNGPIIGRISPPLRCRNAEFPAAVRGSTSGVK